MHLARFFKIRRHFSQNFIRRNADVYGKSEFLIYFLFDFQSCRYGRIELMGNACVVEVTFIHTDLFNIRRIGMKKIHQLSAVGPVKLMIRRLYMDIRAFP